MSWPCCLLGSGGRFRSLPSLDALLCQLFLVVLVAAIHSVGGLSLSWRCCLLGSGGRFRSLGTSWMKYTDRNSALHGWWNLLSSNCDDLLDFAWTTASAIIRLTVERIAGCSFTVRGHFRYASSFCSPFSWQHGLIGWLLANLVVSLGSDCHI